jgi:2,5-furandicarboxylate decarboxylase 1
VLADLRSVVEHFQGLDRVLNIKREVDPLDEIPSLMREAEKRAKIIVFEKVKGSCFPLISNLLGSMELLAAVFRTTPEGVVREWISRVQEPVEPRIAAWGPVKEVLRKQEDLDLRDLPIITHAVKDAGPYITAGIVVAKDPDTGIRNVSVNRMQLKGRNRLGLRIAPNQHLAMIQQKYEKSRQDMDVAVAIGNHPFEMLAAATSLSFGIDEFTISGALRGAPVDLVKCETVDLEVPATAEIVLEGKVLAGVREEEGPFGDFMQVYLPAMENHVLQIFAMSHRHDAIYQTVQSGSAEDIRYLALSREAKIYEAVRPTAEIHALHLAPTLFNCAIAIRKRFEGEAREVARAAFEAHSWLKVCTVVDHDVDVFDPQDLLWALATRANLNHGLFLLKETTGFPRDPFHLHASKLALDATAPLNQWEAFERKSVRNAGVMRLDDYL